MRELPRHAARIPAATLEGGIGALAAAHVPVVLEGFLDGAPLADCADPAVARERLGAVPLRLREEFVSWSLARGGVRDQRPVVESTVAGYLELLEREPGTRLMCTEHPTPPELMEAFGPLPARLAPGGVPASFTFLGARGHHAHLHWDGDFRSVLLVQVFGEKHAVMAPPSSSPWLSPVGNFAGVFIDRLEGERREGFLEAIGACEALLRPGDALFMPAGLWHFLSYPETGLSINLRTSASPACDRLAGRFHPHDDLQRIAWHLGDGHVATAEEEEGVERLMALAGASRGDPMAHAARVESLTAELATRWCGPALASPFAPNARALHEAVVRVEAARLYPPAVADLSLLMGWGTVAR